MRLFSAGIIICLWGIVVVNLTDDYEKEKIIPDVLDKAPESLLQSHQETTGRKACRERYKNYQFESIFICSWSIVLADLTSDFKNAGIIPDALDNAPNQLLSLAYNNVQVEFGKEFTPTAVKDAPTINWVGYDPSSFYILIMIDLDPPSREKPKYREFVHWLITNIPGDDFSKGQTLVEYAGSGPPKDAGFHREIFLVYKQPGKLVFDEQYTANRSIGCRLFFSQRNFIEKYKLGDPVAGNMYTAQFDEYSLVLHSEFIKNLG